MATKVPKIILDDFDDMLDFEKKESVTANATVQRGITEMSFDRMESFSGHKFKLYDGQRLDDMVESIRQFSIQMMTSMLY